ncbi:hypothetical protein M407DRAFT_242362 [Tulasnella calospora MUT 4182]|uniref:Cytochrome P450 n=1 Tax=Tulasnella calospora MUT 4182 TaxID=1051891 RepID=A0A0C3QF80_9AGAM|nr:hypothetical protein M407DRAFT_242362 [Tulasnella calospora MUT 4182]
MATSSETKLLIATAVVAYVVGKRWWAKRGSDVGRLKKPAGAHWLWGHEYEAWDTLDGQFYIKNIDELGQAFGMKGGLFHSDILALTDPAAISHMFTKHPYEYTKSQIIRPLIDRLLGKSLVWAEGDQHKRQRQVLAPVFTNENVKAMDNEIHRAADKLVEVLREHVLSQQAEKGDGGGARVNILDWSGRATLDVIGAVGFGHDFQCGTSEEAKAITRSWRELILMGMEFPGFVAPLVIRAFPIITDLPVEAIQAQGEIKTIVKRIAKQLVEERRAMQNDEGMKSGKDLMSTLLKWNQNAEGEDLDQLLDHICTFVMVGHETISNALNFALYELARNPEMQDKLRKEMTEFVGSGPGGEPTYEEYQSQLPYLDAVCKEGLRMYPPASHTERIALADDVLPLRFPVTTPSGEQLSSIRVKRGQLINVPTIAINRSHTVWGPDAEVFRPERWLDAGGLPAPTSLTQGWSGIFSFLEGPRICIGFRLALFEYKVIMTTLLKNFEFKDTGAVLKTQFSSNLQPFVEGRKQDGIQIPLIVKDLHQ